MKAYCESNALTNEIKEWARSGRIELVHFPYDLDSHSRRMGIAAPSVAQIRDMNLPIRELPGAITDYEPSEHFEKILSIIGREQQYRRDALHVDSALKSRCSVFITRDSDILKHKRQLSDLLGISFFDPENELRELELLVSKSSP